VWSISKELLQRKKPITLPTLALSASGLRFYIELVPLIKSKLTSTNAPQDMVENLSSAATAELKESYEAVVKRIENALINSAGTESGWTDFDAYTVLQNATEITDEVGTMNWLPTSVRETLLGLLLAQIIERRERSKEEIGLNDLDFLGFSVEEISWGEDE
jgi:hypothetical protein